ncbi:zf-HC2 domain-containing protein [Archangium lansingense]|uniref:Zf-HC2 domain-containing protein n=1 Tax=Archangium lansingense TaxID=2995310 RepID=A0ABT4AIF7_9BACT|nr:zf-HC2 domain-containing protein [Archangium lansinium]MCY1081458.1 zf-HC2 domain-containing protein [Archangium lansinium]
MSPPDFVTLRAGRPECPSDFALDRLHSGELPPAEAQAIERHVAGCTECGARMTERQAGFGAIDGVDPRVVLARIRTGLDAPVQTPLSERLSVWARRLLAPVAVATAAIILMVVVPGQEQGTRMKGALALHVFRLTGDHAEEVVSGDMFAPGDRLRFRVDLPGEGHVTIFGVEASGTLYTAWPLEPGVQTRFEEVNGIELPGAVSLDAQLGREMLYLVHCPLEVGPPECTSGGVGEKPVCPAGCVMTSFIMEKGG